MKEDDIALGKEVPSGKYLRLESKNPGLKYRKFPPNPHILEILHLRLAGRVSPLLPDAIRSIAGKNARGVSIHIYQQEELETDLLVQLHYGADAGGEGTADLGERLASLLREYGMIEHSVWKEL